VALGLVVLLALAGLPHAAGAQVDQIEVKHKEHCGAQAPADWRLTTNEPGTVAELTAASGGVYAGWGVTTIDGAKQPYYGPL
jgi:hypothetical protein